MNETTSCDQDLLDASVHGELDARARHRLDDHVAGCASCKVELALLERERALFTARAAREHRAMEPLWQGVAARIAPRRTSRVAAWAGGLVASAAALVLCARFVGTTAPRYSGAALMETTPIAAQPGATVSAQPGEASPPSSPGLHGEGTTWRYEVGDKPSLRMETVAGKVEIERGPVGHIVVSARVSRGVYFELSPNHAKLRISTDGKVDPRWSISSEQDGDEVKVRVWCTGLTCGDAPAVRFKITVPEVTTLSVHGVSADVEAKEVSGALDVETVSGDLSLKRVGTGRIRTTSGDVEWEGHCEKACALGIETVSGDVTIRTDRASGYGLSYKTVSGDRSGDPATAGPGKITVKTVSGDLTEARASGSTRE